MAYMDDLFIVGWSKVKAEQVMELTQQVLKSLGWVINTEKSSLLLLQVMEFLGVLVDTMDTPKFCVPLSKVHTLHHDIKCLLHLHDREGKVPVHRLAAVVGQCSNDESSPSSQAAPLQCALCDSHVEGLE